MKVRSGFLIILSLLSGLSCVQANDTTITDPHFSFVKGYLEETEIPNSLKLLGPPPGKNSKAFSSDEEARTNSIKLHGTERWKQATLDADLTFPQPAMNFSSPMGFEITEKTTPHIYTLMRRILTDAGLSTYAVKNKYARVRPFVMHHERTCTPDQEKILRSDGSYPSGHTAAGWAWALVLSEINPTHADTILKKGLDFGDSRIICNAHWKSDVDAGRIMGAATVAKLHDNAAFIADVNAARQEVKSMLSNEKK